MCAQGNRSETACNPRNAACRDVKHIAACSNLQVCMVLLGQALADFRSEASLWTMPMNSLAEEAAHRSRPKDHGSVSIAPQTGDVRFLLLRHNVYLRRLANTETFA